MEFHYCKHRLEFKVPGGTSRGVLSHKDSWFLVLKDKGKTGVGECSIIEGLSPETPAQVEAALPQISTEIDLGLDVLYQKYAHMPAIQFALEMAFGGLQSEDPFVFFDTPFVKGQNPLVINGLVWMGASHFMQAQIEEKLALGYDCIKLKIGALDFDLECSLLSEMRKRFDKSSLQIRVDANGAFLPEEALEKLERLAQFDIHSIEQPIAVDQWEAMAHLCAVSPVPIALDEELIGRHSDEDKRALLKAVSPQYLILKPSLVGGWKGADHWVELAEEYGIGWWATSALESNVGLNAIAQWCADKQMTMPQGLGTGQLFTNNFESPLYLTGNLLGYDPNKDWKFKF